MILFEAYVWLRRSLIFKLIFNVSIHGLYYCPLIILELLHVLDLVLSTLIAAYYLVQLSSAVVNRLYSLHCADENLG